MTVNAFPIPHIRTANEPIHSPADLQQRWRALMGPLGFGERLIWVAVIGPDNRFTKALTQVEIDCPPDEEIANNLIWAMAEAIGEQSDMRLAALLTRPGSGGMQRYRPSLGSFTHGRRGPAPGQVRTGVPGPRRDACRGSDGLTRTSGRP